MKVAVVILNWNGKNFLEQFLPGVIACSQSDAEVIIADNGSTDDSLAFLQTSFPSIRIIRNTQNEGFAKGYNDALRQIKADIYVLLNSDVEVTPGWIRPIVRLMESDPTIAVCQPKLLSYHHRNYFEYAGAAGGFIDYLGYPMCRGRMFMTLEEDKGQYNDTREIFWATGACMFVRAAVYHQLGGLDDEFFAHMEEVDFCWRTHNAGYKVFYCGESTVYHVGGGTLHKSNPRKTYLNFRNNLLMLYKNLPPRKFYRTMMVRFFLDGLAGLKFFITDTWGDLKAVVRAHFYFHFRHRPSRRKDTQETIKTHHSDFIYKKSLVFDYYVRGKKKFSELTW